MELKDAKCPNCGGQLKLDPSMEKGTCIFCGSEIIVSDAIQKFVGEISGIATTKSSLIHAFNQFEDGDYDGAIKAFKHVIETDPTNAEAYYGVFITSIKIAEYYKVRNSGMERAIPQYYADLAEAANKYGFRAVKYASEPEKTKYQNELNPVLESIEQYRKNPAAYQQQKSKDGCYIATAVYGSYDCPEVWTLRRFRDNTLSISWAGRLFIRIYYAISPQIIKTFGYHKWFNTFWRYHLDNMVKNLQRKGVSSAPYIDSAK